MSKRTASPGLGSIASGALTAGSMLVVSGIAAVIGVVIGREFGSTAETDGLLAAYGLFVVVVIAAQAIRVAVLPQLAQARAENRLAGELAGFALALAVVSVPVLLLTLLGADLLAEILTGQSSGSAHETAVDALRWIGPASVAHLFAALAASGLAALDDYGTAAFGYAVGSVSGLALILARVEPDGIVAVAWGIALNGTIAMVVPVVGLAVRAARERMPRGAVRPRGVPLRSRLGSFAVGAALPLALQLLYVICLPFASRLGTGSATSFVYAYLAASSLVTVAAGSLGIVTSVPLARTGLSAAETTRHVVATSWLALLLVGGAAGTFAIAGQDVVEGVLGGSFGGDVGEEIGGLVVALSPWMIAAVGVSVTFPLAFVASRTRGLPWIALGVLVLQVPLAWAGAAALELTGLALALALSTVLVLTALLWELDALAETARSLGSAAATVTALTLLAFLPTGVMVGSVPGAAFGLLVYIALFVLVRPSGLATSWRYLRALS